MTDFFEVELRDWEIQKDKRDPEKAPFNQVNESFLCFVGRNLTRSPLLQDLSGYDLGFYGGSHENFSDNEESWANPLRASVLQSLTSDSTRWYLSFHTYLAQINVLPFQRLMKHRFIKENNLNFAVVHAEQWASGIPNRSRLFFEVPTALLTEMVLTFWSGDWKATTPFEGYLLPPGRLDLLTAWDTRRRDDKLFRDVLDQSSLAFFTNPSENRHFAFITSKYTQEDLERKIDLESLQKRAKEIGLKLSSRILELHMKT